MDKQRHETFYNLVCRTMNKVLLSQFSAKQQKFTRTILVSLNNLSTNFKAKKMSTNQTYARQIFVQ